MSLLLTAVTPAVFWPVRLNDFVNYDDPSYVTDNTHVQHGLTWQGVVSAFRTGHSANWHPLTWLSHMLDCQLYELRPWGHHVTSLLFHTTNTLLLFLLFRSVTGAMWRSALVAALFAFHPLHVESVAWVAERKDVLSTFFGLLSLLAYVLWVEKSKVQGPKSKVEGQVVTFHASRFYLLSLLLFALSLMSKPMLVTLPCLLLLLDYWPLRRLELPSADARVQGSKVLRLFVEKLPFLALTAVSCLLTIRVQGQAGAVASAELLPSTVRVLNALLAIVACIGKLFWPVNLYVFYPYPTLWPAARIVLAVVVLIALSAAAFRWRGTKPYFIVGWLWFLGTLVLAFRACTLTGSTNATYVETLAAAYAEVGMFTEALSVQQMACELATSQGQSSQAAFARNRLELYRSQKPFREP